MDFYYRKSMGNGTVASKFRLNSIQLNQSNMRVHQKEPSISKSQSQIPENDNRQIRNQHSNVSRQEKVAENKAANNSNVERTQESKTDYVSSSSSLSSSPKPRNPSVSAEITNVGNKNSSSNIKGKSIDSNVNVTNGDATAKIATDSNKYESNLHTFYNNNQNQQPSEITSKMASEPADNYPIESPETHHPSNCIRCYRLKKKCSRQYPKCSTCTKGHFDCEYVTRSNKRKRRKKADLNNLENTIDLTQNSDIENQNEIEPDLVEHSNAPSSTIFHIEATGKDGNVDKSVVAHKLVSVSSLLTDETPDPSKLVSTHESSRPRKVPSAALSSMARRTREHNESLAEKSTKKLFHPLKTNLNDDFITVLPMKNYISATFVYNYFENFGSKYPFVNKEEFMQRFVKIDFNKEAIVNLDIYMVMSIGCIIYDSYSNVSLFDKFFKESIIESIVDGLDFTFNGQNSEKEELQNLELITLLTIYSIASLNKQNCWALVGVLNRLALQLDLYKATDNVRKQRLFWSIHNIEMELSLLLNKPAQTPQDKFITLDYPLKNKYFKCEEEVLLSHEIWYAKIQEKILVLQLSNDDDKQKLVTLSSEIEKWRVGISGVVHRVYRESSLLKNYTDLINLNYYYLLVELDQLSPNKSFQFTLQFVSNSFSILTSNAEVEIDNEDQNSGSKKPVVRLSLASSLFWYKKLFKVVRFNMDSLSRMIASTTTVKFDFGIKLNEFRSNISLITNLLKYVQGIKHSYHSKAESDLFGHIGKTVVYLEEVNKELMIFDAQASSEEERKTLSEKIDEMRDTI
ncbi:hypothetical protein G9P44_001334 [Scheffersomyces stipitis]|nr:hypothetical protein G9P44_001334 [Scheffersomyces stipitis]